MKNMKGSSGGDVTVEMNAAPGTDLTKLLNDMRARYEQMTEQNRQEIEEQFKKQVNVSTKHLRLQSYTNHSYSLPQPATAVFYFHLECIPASPDLY
jgi:hypothetical protein